MAETDAVVEAIFVEILARTLLQSLTDLADDPGLAILGREGQRCAEKEHAECFPHFASEEK